MTLLKYDANTPELAKIVTTNSLVTDMIRRSPSRVWVNREWYYPIQELEDVFKYLSLAQEQYTLDPKVQNALDIYNKRIEMLRKFKSGDISEVNLNNPVEFTKTLLPRQKPVAAQLLLMKRQLLALEVGMGKTVISLFTILKLRQLLPIKALIICESNQLHKPWLETVLDFSTVKNPVVIDGTAAQRTQKLTEAKSNLTDNWLWLMSYDVARIEADNLPDSWDIIIFDEVTKIKNISAKTSKVLFDFKAPYRIGLSGTPVTNTYFDLYGIMKVINPLVFTTKQNFSDTYLKLDFFNRPTGLLEGAEAELSRKIFPWVLQQSKEEMGISKPIHIKTFPAPLTIYQREALALVQSQIDNGEKSSFSSQTKLRQICNTVKIFPEYADKPLEETTSKVELLKQIAADVVGKQKKKLIVFSFFKPVAEILRQELEKEYRVRVVTGETKKTCRQPAISSCYDCPLFTGKCASIKKKIFEFTEGDVQIILGTDSLSRSHNLYTCDTLVNFDLPWNDADMIQRIGRIDRGEKNSAPEFFVYNLATMGTVEEKIIKLIERKARESGKVFPKFSVRMRKLSSTIIVK